jgi:hypothetical protein
LGCGRKLASMPEARPPRRTPTSVRIAAWRRRILVGSLGLFVAAWLAVIGLGKQASSTAAPAKTTTTNAQSQTQTQSQTYDPYSTDDSGYDDGSSQSDSSSSDDSAQSIQSDDMSGATTSQS